jgi:hypothetical protein
MKKPYLDNIGRRFGKLTSSSSCANQFFRPKIGDNIRRYTGGVNAIACGYRADEAAAT